MFITRVLNKILFCHILNIQLCKFNPTIKKDIEPKGSSLLQFN